MPLFINKKPYFTRNKTNLERLDKKLMFLLHKQIGLSIIDPNHRLNAVNNLQSSLGQLLIALPINFQTNKLVLFFFLPFKYGILEHILFPQWIWGISVGLYTCIIFVLENQSREDISDGINYYVLTGPVIWINLSLSILCHHKLVLPIYAYISRL